MWKFVFMVFVAYVALATTLTYFNISTIDFATQEQLDFYKLIVP